MGAHNGLGARLVERHFFDGVWASGLEVSTAHGLPDANILTMTENLEAARAMNDATQLPVVCDCDTGYGNASNVMHMVRRYETAGLAAIVIEDQRFPKLNSLVQGRQELVSLEEFVGKIRAAKEAQRGADFMVFARVEALIAGFGLEEALRRAQAYADAGADGIVIHSKASTPDEIFAFARSWKGRAPLVAIPTTYFKVTASELEREGFSMVIYANQGLRASIRALDRVFETIMASGTTAAVEREIASLEEVFELQGLTRMKEEEKRFLDRGRVRAVIPAARDHRFQADLMELLKDKPLCMVDIAGRTLLERQVDLLRSAGVQEVTVVGGHLHDKIKAEAVTVLYNPDYERCGCAHSILQVQNPLNRDVLILYSDILFDPQILERLLRSPHEITLVIDRAYRTLPPRDKPLDLVWVEETPSAAQGPRDLRLSGFKRIRSIGKRVPREKAGHEFIGLAYLRGEGFAKLQAAWAKALSHVQDRPYYESPTVEKADFTDLMLDLLDEEVPVFGMEIDHGWSEIHSLDDHERVCSHFQSKPTVPAAPSRR
jgi:phosphoenolpyruvate phosphomutase